MAVVGRRVGRLIGSRADAERVEGGRRWRKTAADRRVGVVVVVVGGIVVVGGGAAHIGGVVLRNVGGVGVIGGRMG